MLVRAGEFPRMMRRPRVYAVGVAVDGDRGDRDRRLKGEPGLDRRIRLVSGGEPVAMPVGVNDHLDEIGIVERRGGALEGRLVEPPCRRPLPPQEPRDGAPVLGEAAPAALV